MYLYIFYKNNNNTKTKTKKWKGTDNQSERQMKASWSDSPLGFTGPSDGPPPLVAELAGGLTSHKLRRIDHRRNTIHNSTRSKPRRTHTSEHAHTRTHTHKHKHGRTVCKKKRLCIDRPERGCARTRPV